MKKPNNEAKFSKDMNSITLKESEKGVDFTTPKKSKFRVYKKK